MAGFEVAGDELTLRPVRANGSGVALVCDMWTLLRQCEAGGVRRCRGLLDIHAFVC
jgi:hypothetical protein